MKAGYSVNFCPWGCTREGEKLGGLSLPCLSFSLQINPPRIPGIWTNGAYIIFNNHIYSHTPCHLLFLSPGMGLEWAGWSPIVLKSPLLLWLYL